MAINIKDAEADQLARRLATLTGESITVAIKTAVRERIERDGLRYAGTHLIIDLWDGEHFDDVGVIELALRGAVQAAGATLLHLHLHEFTAGGGVSGVAVLAESHISIHTWPERGYAAIDVFMCGSAEPHKVVPVLRHIFKAHRMAISEQMRGIL